jgi:hypothetical protein
MTLGCNGAGGNVGGGLVRQAPQMVPWADLTGLYERFSNLGSSEADLTLVIRSVQDAIGGIETQVLEEP